MGCNPGLNYILKYSLAPSSRDASNLSDPGTIFRDSSVDHNTCGRLKPALDGSTGLAF